MSDLLGPIRERVAAYAGRDLDPALGVGGMTQAGVLLPLLVRDGEVTVLLTKRSRDMKKHRGELSFPGGKRDPEDASLLACALRETQEEIGLPPELVEIAGRLDETPVLTHYRMTPYVGFVPYPFDFILNKDEIESLIFAPLSLLMDPARHRMTVNNWLERRIPIHFYELGGEVVWGATGRVLTQLLRICFDYVPPAYAAFLAQEHDPLLIL